MSDDLKDPPRWRDRPGGGDGPEGRAAAMSRAIGEPRVPSDVALARMRTGVVDRIARTSRFPVVAAAATVLVTLAASASVALWLGRERVEPARTVEEAEAPASTAATDVKESRRPRNVPRPPAPVAGASELDLLRGLSPAALLAVRAGTELDGEGFTAENRTGFICSGAQGVAFEAMTVGAALRRPDLIDEGWRAIDATLRFQTEDGSFLDSAVCVSYWLAYLSHALLVLQESEEGLQYQHRVRALLPRVERAATWLMRDEQRQALKESSQQFPSRLAFNAVAFGLGGRLLGNPALESLAAEQIELLLASQRPDGSFAMSTRIDIIYQGNVLWKLSWYALRFPDPRIDEALRRGGRWQLKRIEPDGTVDAHEVGAVWEARRDRHRKMNTRDIAWALLYYGSRFGDNAALSAAERVLARNKARVTPL